MHITTQHQTIYLYKSFQNVNILQSITILHTSSRWWDRATSASSLIVLILLVISALEDTFCPCSSVKVQSSLTRSAPGNTKHNKILTTNKTTIIVSLTTGNYIKYSPRVPGTPLLRRKNCFSFSNVLLSLLLISE